MKRISIYTKLIITLLLTLAIFYKLNIKMDFNWINGILGASVFLFSILIAFSIANRHSRFDDVRTKLREQDASLLNIYFLSKTFGKNISNQIKQKIDDLLISQIDYNLIDFDIESPKKLQNIFDYIEKLNPKTKPQKESHEKMLDSLKDLLNIQETISYRVKNKMMVYEWVNLILLGGVIIFCFLVLNDLSVKSIIILSICTSAITLLFFILQEINSLKWQEKSWIWIPLINLFEELELLPYLPEEIFYNNRLKYKDITKARKIRLVKYPNKYPNMKDKKVITLDLRNSIKK